MSDLDKLDAPVAEAPSATAEPTANEVASVNDKSAEVMMRV